MDEGNTDCPAIRYVVMFRIIVFLLFSLWNSYENTVTKITVHKHVYADSCSKAGKSCTV
jgi:hypothetical protein